MWYYLFLKALLPTRRWFNTVLDDSHLVVHCYLSSLAKRDKEGHLFCQVRPAFVYWISSNFMKDCSIATEKWEWASEHHLLLAGIWECSSHCQHFLPLIVLVMIIQKRVRFLCIVTISLSLIVFGFFWWLSIFNLYIHFKTTSMP